MLDRCGEGNRLAAGHVRVLTVRAVRSDATAHVNGTYHETKSGSRSRKRSDS